MRGAEPNGGEDASVEVRPISLDRMSEVQSGLEGVVAFATEIAEPDKEGGALRYRGVDIEELVGKVPFEKVWGLLVDGSFDPGLPPAEPWPLTVRSGDPRVDVQSALAMLRAALAAAESCPQQHQPRRCQPLPLAPVRLPTADNPPGKRGLMDVDVRRTGNPEDAQGDEFEPA